MSLDPNALARMVYAVARRRYSMGGPVQAGFIDGPAYIQTSDPRIAPIRAFAEGGGDGEDGGDNEGVGAGNTGSSTDGSPAGDATGGTGGGIGSEGAGNQGGGGQGQGGSEGNGEGDSEGPSGASEGVGAGAGASSGASEGSSTDGSPAGDATGGTGAGVGSSGLGEAAGAASGIGGGSTGSGGYGGGDNRGGSDEGDTEGPGMSDGLSDVGFGIGSGMAGLGLGPGMASETTGSVDSGYQGVSGLSDVAGFSGGLTGPAEGDDPLGGYSSAQQAVSDAVSSPNFSDNFAAEAAHSLSGFGTALGPNSQRSSTAAQQAAQHSDFLGGLFGGTPASALSGLNTMSGFEPDYAAETSPPSSAPSQTASRHGHTPADQPDRNAPIGILGRDALSDRLGTPTGTPTASEVAAAAPVGVAALGLSPNTSTRSADDVLGPTDNIAASQLTGPQAVGAALGTLGKAATSAMADVASSVKDTAVRGFDETIGLALGPAISGVLGHLGFGPPSSTQTAQATAQDRETTNKSFATPADVAMAPSATAVGVLSGPATATSATTTGLSPSIGQPDAKDYAAFSANLAGTPTGMVGPSMRGLDTPTGVQTASLGPMAGTPATGVPGLNGMPGRSTPTSAPADTRSSVAPATETASPVTGYEPADQRDRQAALAALATAAVTQAQPTRDTFDELATPSQVRDALPETFGLPPGRPSVTMDTPPDMVPSTLTDLAPATIGRPPGPATRSTTLGLPEVMDTPPERPRDLVQAYEPVPDERVVDPQPKTALHDAMVSRGLNMALGMANPALGLANQVSGLLGKGTLGSFAANNSQPANLSDARSGRGEGGDIGALTLAALQEAAKADDEAKDKDTKVAQFTQDDLRRTRRYLGAGDDLLNYGFRGERAFFAKRGGMPPARGGALSRYGRC